MKSSSTSMKKKLIFPFVSISKMVVLHLLKYFFRETQTYEKRNILSDSSDFEDDDKSQRSSPRGKIITNNIGQN